jgi:hypothetical protein
MLAATYDPNGKATDAFSQDNMVDGTTNKNYTATEKTKLAGIASGAQVNPGNATTSTAGLMSAADKTKLDGVASGATANTGTVTSVGASVPTGLSISGSPVTTSGTLSVTWASGYQAYTSAEATKLSGIAAGAEVNVNADWNASSGDAQILNKPSLATVATTGAYSDLSGKPTLGTAAATASTDYATAAQGAKADTAVQSVVAGTNVTVDNTDPKNPIVNASGGGGGGNPPTLYTSSQTITILGTKAYVRMVSSAGGSAGTTSATSNTGTCGSYLVALLTGLTIGNTLIYTQGAVGSGGSAGNNAGGNAGDSTLASGTETISTLTCPGGKGGPNNASKIASSTSSPTGGSINLPGISFFPTADNASTTFFFVPGNSPPGGFGIGGSVRTSVGAGISGSGYGSSAGNSYSSGTNIAGTAGQPGVLEITWFS